MAVNPLTMYLKFGQITGMWRTVTLTQMTNAGPGTAVIVNKAIRGAPVSTRLLAANAAALVRIEAVYSIPLALTGAVAWHPGDLLTDANQEHPEAAGVTYRIISAAVDEGFWLLSVFDPQIAFNLKNTCTILAITEGRTDARTRTAAIAAVPAWTNLACRIQPSASEWAVQNGKVGDLRTFDIFLDADLAISPTSHVVQWTDPDTSATVTADIRQVTMRQRLDEPMRLVVELRVGP